MVNATHWRLYEQLRATGRSVEGGSGGRTKKQRTEHGFPKEHYYDALCRRKHPHILHRTARVRPSLAGAGPWQPAPLPDGPRQLSDSTSGPTKQHRRSRPSRGVLREVHRGIGSGHVTIPATGRFDIVIEGHKVAQGIAYKYCHVLQRGDGWQYAGRYVS